MANNASLYVFGFLFLLTISQEGSSQIIPFLAEEVIGEGIQAIKSMLQCSWISPAQVDYWHPSGTFHGPCADTAACNWGCQKNPEYDFGMCAKSKSGHLPGHYVCECACRSKEYIKTVAQQRHAQEVEGYRQNHRALYRVEYRMESEVKDEEGKWLEKRKTVEGKFSSCLAIKDWATFVLCVTNEKKKLDEEKKSKAKDEEYAEKQREFIRQTATDFLEK